MLDAFCFWVLVVSNLVLFPFTFVCWCCGWGFLVVAVFVVMCFCWVVLLVCFALVSSGTVGFGFKVCLSCILYALCCLGRELLCFEF